MRERYDIRRPVITSSTFPYYAKRILIFAVILSGALLGIAHQETIRSAIGGAKVTATPHKKTFAQREADALAAEQSGRKGLDAVKTTEPLPVRSGRGSRAAAEAPTTAEPAAVEKKSSRSANRGGRGDGPIDLAADPRALRAAIDAADKAGRLRLAGRMKGRKIAWAATVVEAYKSKAGEKLLIAEAGGIRVWCQFAKAPPKAVRALAVGETIQVSGTLAAARLTLDRPRVELFGPTVTAE